MLDSNSAELFAKGSLAWASMNAIKFLQLWHETIGWSKETAIPSHVITFKKDGDTFYPHKPYYLDFKDGLLSEDITQEDFIPKPFWRGIIKTLLKEEGIIGYVFIAESYSDSENRIIVSYEGIGDNKLISIINFNLVDEELVFEDSKTYSLDNIAIQIESELTNIFDDKTEEPLN